MASEQTARKPELPFGKLGRERTNAEWAALHAGVEFLPANEREALCLRQQGYDVVAIGMIMRVHPDEIKRMLGRSCRTLATWERNACKWATRFVAIEPWSEDGRSWRPGDAKAPEVI